MAAAARATGRALGRRPRRLAVPLAVVPVMRLGKWQRAFLALLLLSPAMRLATYRSWADGAFGQYLPSVVVVVGLAALAWIVLRWQMGPGAALPWIAAVAVLVPGDVMHYRRLAYGPATTFERLVIEGFTAAEPDGRPSAQRWLVEVSPDAAVQVADGQLLIEDPAGAIGYIDLRLPPRPTFEDVGLAMPQGLLRGRFAEALEWDAAVQRQSSAFVMLDAQSVRIEVIGLGLQVTYRGENGKAVDVDLSTSLPNDGQMHRYRMERTRSEYRLVVDGRPLLSGVPAGHAPHWDFVRLGNTRSDAAHGGAMRLDNVEYLQRFYAD